MTIRFRPLADSKYRPALESMGVTHGEWYDCQREACTRCTPYRELERAYWLNLSDKEKAEVVFGRYGI